MVRLEARCSIAKIGESTRRNPDANDLRGATPEVMEVMQACACGGSEPWHGGEQLGDVHAESAHSDDNDRGDE